MTEAVIVDAVRTPMGRGKTGGGGAFEDIHPIELLKHAVTAIIERNGLDPEMVDDFICGCVSGGGEQSYLPGRMAWLAAGYPDTVPSVTVNRACGSSQQAIQFAAQAVIAGASDIMLAGGIESMSRVPMGSHRMGADVYGPSASARYAPGLVGQGISAELIAARWNISREDMDEFSAQSHAKASKARDSGHFDTEIVPIEVMGEAGPISIRADETIRTGTSVEKLSTLRTSFDDEEIAARFPEIDWRITAGNSSQLTDGASVTLIMSERRAKDLDLTPRARFVGFAVCGGDPIEMLTAPIPATQRVLETTGMGIDTIDYYEVNEAFASVPLAWLKDTGADPQKLNPSGGAIALGHPLGASGARLMTTMLNGMERSGARYGLQTMCEAGGMANATIIERI